MKKLVMLSLGLVLGVANAAETANSETTKPKEQAQQPVAVLRVFDTSGSSPKVLDKNRFSRSKARELCLIVGNVPVQENNLFVHYLQAPAAFKVDVPADIAKVEAEENGKNYLITKNVTKAEMLKGEAAFCWRFGKEDPIGEYKVDAQFNDIVFKNLKFTVLK